MTLVTGHIRILAGRAPGGHCYYEALPAEPVSPGVYDVLGSPGLATGCAAGDRIRIATDGTFEVVRRGGNLCLVLYPHRGLDDSGLAALCSAFSALGGVVEAPADRRFLVVTVPVTAGFAAVEEAAAGWAAARDCQWQYGNVYDPDGRPLGWWG